MIQEQMGCYSKYSDIDLLILIPDNRSTRELRYLRHELEDRIEKLHPTRSVDIKLYHEKRYEALCQRPSFEQCIQKDLISLMEW